MPISRRFVVQSTTLLLAVGFMALLAIVVATFWLNERAQRYFDDVAEARFLRATAFEVRNALQAAESSQRGFLSTGNEIYLAPYDTAKAKAQDGLAALTGRLDSGNGTRPMVQRLTAVVTEKFDEMAQTVDLKRGGRDAEALAILRTNRGKALMDEANVFLAGVVFAADERLATGVAEQKANASWVRWISIVGAIVIFLVVACVTATVLTYARETARARDQVRTLATSLEERVQRRTADLGHARDRAEVLLAEVNHRVANSLALVSSLVKLQAGAVRDQAAKDALDETQARIFAIASVHKRLYTAGDARYVAADDYLSGLLENLERSMREEGHAGAVRHELEPLQLQTDAGVNLGIVVTEWVTNAFKYAYPDRRGEVRVKLKTLPDQRAELTVEDDGVGRADNAPARGTGLGTKLVNAIAATMGAEIQYQHGSPGTIARLIMPMPAPRVAA